MIPFRPCRNQSGNVAVFFALAIIPIVGVVGLSMDYEATINSKTKVQSVVDTAILAASKHYQAGGDKNATESFAQSMIKDQLDYYNADLECAAASVTVGADDKALGISIDCDHDTSLMRVFGITETDFTVTSNSRWNYDSLEVSFVFDMSGSMSGLENDLAAAATMALDVLVPQTGSPPIANTRIAMVNYNTYLNAGDLFEAATGLTPTRTYQMEDNYIDADGNPASRTVSITVDSTCVAERIGVHAFSDVAPDPTHPTAGSVTTPVSVIDAEVASYDDGKKIGRYGVTGDDDNPHGFVSAGYYFLIDDPNRKDDIWYPRAPITAGSSAYCRPLGPLPLTDDRDDMDDYLDDFDASRATGGQLGIAWGWYLLSENWKHLLPTSSAPADYSDSSTLKALIFMTDGFMYSPDIGLGGGDPQARALCDRIKADTHIRIYTVGFNLTSSTAKRLLEHCASSPEHYFLADDATALANAYLAIADDLVDLRITS